MKWGRVIGINLVGRMRRDILLFQTAICMGGGVSVSRTILI